jgi:hypothetical protein
MLIRSAKHDQGNVIDGDRSGFVDEPIRLRG